MFLSHNLCSNYRPISILPCFSKIYEKIIFKRLKHHLSMVNVPSKNQIGFQEKCSTYMAVSSVYEEITSAMDCKMNALGVFIDLSKAFDTVDHKILILKLLNYGVRGMPLEIMKSYLSNRSQFVSINDTWSSLLPVLCGVPQGSILGPLLFLGMLMICNFATIS